MGNKPTRNKIQQPYNQMVEDAISALKDRPGSTQSDVFNYLETKYEGRIPPKAKKNLETVIRSVIRTKKGLKGRPTRRTGRKVRYKPKGALRRRPGRLQGRGKGRKLGARPGKDSKKKTHKTLKSGKKLQMPGSKSGGHRLLKRVHTGISRDRKHHHRSMSRRSVGSFGLPRRSKECSKRNECCDHHYISVESRPSPLHSA